MKGERLSALGSRLWRGWRLRALGLTAAGLLAVIAPGCGDGGNQATTAAAGDTQKESSVSEDRWLRGLWANDIRQALGGVNMKCSGPVIENKFSVWSCESGTPLVSYKTRFYGMAPGKIEYITATVSQTERPKDEIVLRVFVALAGLHFEGSDPAKARAWVRDNLGTGGNTVFGPAKFKLQGDERRRQLDIKASGSEW